MRYTPSSSICPKCGNRYLGTAKYCPECSVPIDIQINPDNPALTGAIMFYSASCFSVFNRLTFEQCQEAAEAAGEAAQHDPLWMRNKKGEFDQYDIPHFGKRSSVYVMAIMSAWLVWIQKKIYGYQLPDSPLLAASVSGLALFDEALSDYWANYNHIKVPDWF